MDSEDWMNAEHMTGTSIVAVEYNGGVVVGADSRSSMGSYVSNRVADKLTKVSNRIFCCRSGSAADTQAIADVVSYQMEMLQMELGEPVSVKTAANAFRQLCYNYRDALSAGIICAGWDKVNGGQVYSIPLGGMVMRQPMVIGGSGSTYVYGFADSKFKPGMELQEAVDFVVMLLTLAMQRDGSSGGIVRTAVITEKGVERKTFLPSDLPELCLTW